MENLQKDFQKRTKTALRNLAESLSRNRCISPELRREIFRVLHTLKGTSQTLGFSQTSKIAHNLENLLTEKKEKNLRKKLQKGFLELIDSLQIIENETKNQEKTVDAISTKSSEINGFEDEFFKQFSEYEKKIIFRGIKAGKKLYSVDAVFDLNEFSVKLKNLREKLLEKGEIVAVFPNQNNAANGKIGFRIFSIFKEKSNELKKISDTFSVEINYHSLNFTNNLNTVLDELKTDGLSLAEKIGKQIKIKIAAENLELSADKVNLIFDVCTHLLRNAIDHAIETPEERNIAGKKPFGQIKIAVKSAKKGIKIIIKDDGKGIDTEKIRKRAIEKKIISARKTLTENELIDLIFLHEFSTAETVTNISGRGIGLDAVKNLLENAGGKISVKSRRKFGTTFEVFLRYDKSKDFNKI